MSGRPGFLRAGSVGYVPPRVGGLLVSGGIERLIGLDNHVLNVRRQNIVLDAAVIAARRFGFLADPASVAVTAARLRNFRAEGAYHAARV
jgi:hypothetical protein